MTRLTRRPMLQALLLTWLTTAVVSGQAIPPAAPAQEKLVGWLEITGSLLDREPPMAFISADTRPSLRSITSQLQHVAADKRFVGVVLYLDEPDLSPAQVAELEQAVTRLRAAGKTVLAYSEAYDLRAYLLACSADKILLLRKGLLELTGLGMEEMYLAGLLSKIGAKADMIQVGKFKGAAEPLTQSAPSPEWERNISALLDDVYEQLLHRVTTARNLDRAKVEAAFRDSWTMSDEDYVKRGLIDALVDRDLVEVTEQEFGEDFEWDQDMGRVDPARAMTNPLALFQMLFQGPKQVVRRPSLAVIHAYGQIHSGDSAQGRAGEAGLFGGQSIGSKTIVSALGDARDNELIKGVVLRIDSPGGSALASEVMWQAIRDCAKEKPVYVSIGDLAASGGYYLACAGTKIYASPDSIIGSIGVVGGKFVLGDLYAKVGVNVTRRSRGPLGDMFNSVEPFNDEQRQALSAAMNRIYDQFTDRVATGRKNKIANLEQVAQGRLFTGRQAVLNGLIDQLGGVDVAVADLAGELGLPPGGYDLIDLPEPKSLAEYLQQLFEPFGAAAPEMQALFGPRTWRAARATLAGVMLLRREPVITLMPVVIQWK